MTTREELLASLSPEEIFARLRSIMLGHKVKQQIDGYAAVEVATVTDQLRAIDVCLKYILPTYKAVEMKADVRTTEKMPIEQQIAAAREFASLIGYDLIPRLPEDDPDNDPPEDGDGSRMIIDAEVVHDVPANVTPLFPNSEPEPVQTPLFQNTRTKLEPPKPLSSFLRHEDKVRNSDFPVRRIARKRGWAA